MIDEAETYLPKWFLHENNRTRVFSRPLNQRSGLTIFGYFRRVMFWTRIYKFKKRFLVDRTRPQTVWWKYNGTYYSAASFSRVYIATYHRTRAVTPVVMTLIVISNKVPLGKSPILWSGYINMRYSYLCLKVMKWKAWKPRRIKKLIEYFNQRDAARRYNLPRSWFY